VEYYVAGRNFAERNRDWIAAGLELGERAAGEALARAGLRAAEIDHFFFVTTTGLATPSLDALLAHRLGCRSDIVRHPLFGIGCAGGAAMLGRAAAVLRAEPSKRALLLSVELCSQTFRSADGSMTNLVGAALFGDGAAAVVVDGGGAAGFRIADAASELFAGSERVMGWEFGGDGMRLVMSPEIPAVVRELAMPAVRRFVAGRSVAHWVLHPGGPRVLEAYGLDEASLAPARRSLREHGNLSSAAVLFELAEVEARPGDAAVVAAVGPGFGIEMAYLVM
jgi:alkylresorcinol/alkylpyrone synthase